MNESEEQNKLAIIFNHFNIIIKYTRNKQATFFFSDNLDEFYEKYDEYSKCIMNGGKHDLDSLKEFYESFKIYSPSTGKCKLILQSVDTLFQSIQRHKAYHAKDSDGNDQISSKSILNLIESDAKQQIASLKQKIADYQNKIMQLNIQKKILDQECITKIQNASDFVNQISDICKEMAPENLKKADDHNIRMISDLIYIIEEMQ